MKGTIQTFIDARNQSDKWSVLLSNKRYLLINVTKDLESVTTMSSCES